jgi:hypothetical protein
MTQTEDVRLEAYDAELEALEESLDRGEPWKYPTKPDEVMDPAMPNPLVIRATGISTGTIKGEELSFLNGVDARGKKWSRIIGSKSLREGLIDGVISEWDEGRQAYVETARVGPVESGEKVVLTFRGFSTIKSGEHKGKEIPSVKVDRPDAHKLVTPTAQNREGIPFE